MGESKMLKVTGILMIIGAAFGLIAGITLPIITQAAAEIDPSLALDGTTVMMLSLTSIVAGAVQLVAGIMGVRNWKKPDKAQICFILGIVIIAISLINNIISIGSSGFSSNVLTNALIGLILPGLYTYGAMQLKKSA